MAIVYAKSSLSTTSEHGVVHKLTVGEAWDADDPIVQQRPHLFDSSPPRIRTSKGWVETPVETATSKPGTKRHTKRG